MEYYLAMKFCYLIAIGLLMYLLLSMNKKHKIKKLEIVIRQTQEMKGDYFEESKMY